MRPPFRLWIAVALGGLLGAAVESADTRARPVLPVGTVELSDNGAWSWFMDERAIVDRGRLVAGSVRANGTFEQKELPGWGNVELSVLDLSTRERRRIVLHEGLEQDDHDSPGLLVLSDGRYLAAYSRHSVERRMFWRLSTRPGDPFEWGEERSVVTPGQDHSPFGGDNVTYANPFRLAAEPGRLYLFYRGSSHDPNYLVSDDGGQSWTYGGHLLRGRGGYAPYLKYASDGVDTIHFVATEDHPRNFDNSLYHGFIRNHEVHYSDGRRAGPLSTSTDCTLHAWDLTRVFQGDPDNVAWMTDIHLDRSGRPVVLFTVQKDGAGLPPGQGGLDHRFDYARWDGRRWQVHEIAFAGTRLYAGEDDYTGLGAIDPLDTSTVVVSTDADPATGRPLVSRTDDRRHRELFRGRTRDGGASWTWDPVTRDSTADHLRPVIPVWPDARRLALVWMHGTYTSNHGAWTTRILSAVLDRDHSPSAR